MINFENQTDIELLKLIQRMSDDELHKSAVKTSEKERRITLLLLQHLNEIEKRHLFSKFNCSSLHVYCVKELKMDDGTAGRRVSAARLLRDIPMTEEKILSGTMCLTSVAQAGVFFKKEAKNGNTFTQDEKHSLVLELDGKSTREVEKILISKSDQPEIHFTEKIIPKTESSIEVRLYLDEETMAALSRLKEIWSHAIPNGSLAEIVKRLAEEAIERHDPVKKLKPVTSAPELGSKNLELATLSKAEIKRFIWRRDQAQCTFEDPRTGERCSSKHFIEEDHILPKAMGGDYSIKNLRLRCRAHNQRHAINCYGQNKMRDYLPSMQDDG